MPSSSETPQADPTSRPVGPQRTPGHGPARALPRPARWTLACLGVVLAIVVLLAAAVALIDWNQARPWVNGKVSEATGRHFAIEGHLSVEWRWPQPLEDGWHRWVPGVAVAAQDIELDNPTGFTPPFSTGKVGKAAKSSEQAKASNSEKDAGDGKTLSKDSQKTAQDKAATATDSDVETKADAGAQAGATDMVRVQSAVATVRLLPLLGRVLSVSTVDLTGPDIRLARTADGTSNWTFERKDGPKGGWTFDVDRIMVRDGVIAYADAVKDVDLTAHVDTIDDGAVEARPTLTPEAPAPAASRPVKSSTPDKTGEKDAPKTPTAGASAAQPTASSSASAVSQSPRDAASDAAGTGTGTGTGTGSASVAPVPYGVRFTLDGRLAKAQVKGSGRAGQVLSLRDKIVNYPLQLEATAGSVVLKAEGVLANPGSLDGMDFEVFLKGASMADLYDLTGLVLPSTPPFETTGRLTGSLEPKRAIWEYNDFNGKVGQSDLHGDLKYVSGKPRPKLTGNMSSNQLRLTDLGPTLGTNQPDNTHRGRDASGKRGKVLPDSKFAAERWNAMDMDITFAGKNIVRPESVPLQNLSVRAVMQGAQLSLAPLTFGVAQGKITSEVRVDGRSPPLKGEVRGNIEGLQLSALFPKVELMKKSFGRMDGAIALKSSGNSMASLLGDGTGELRLYVRDGTLSKEMLDLAALNLGSIVVSKLFGDDKEVRMRCAVADFSVVDGLATARTVKMSTEDAIVEATGTIDLGTEELNLRIKPESLEWKFFSLRSPLYVRGTFGNPDVGVEAGPLLLRAGAAVVAAIVAPAALALVPLTVPSADDDTLCQPLLAKAQKPVKPGAKGSAR